MTPYLLLAPGALTTSDAVKNAMDTDMLPLDPDFLAHTQHLRRGLLRMAKASEKATACALVAGLGTTALEATLQTAIPRSGACVLVGVNGGAGRRIVAMLQQLAIPHVAVIGNDRLPLTRRDMQAALAAHQEITHMAIVHCETTTGVINPLSTITPFMHDAGVITIVDARTSFAGIPLEVETLGIDYLVADAARCLQGVPGVSFVIASRHTIAQTRGNARSLTLDLYEQLACMEVSGGRWRHACPTHALLAADQALGELIQEGGVSARYQRFRHNQHLLSSGMQALGFELIVAPVDQSPFVTSFAYPQGNFDYACFAAALRERGFVIDPEPAAEQAFFRIATIGTVDRDDVRALLAAVHQVQAPAITN